MEKLKCIKCEYQWIQRTENLPKACPKCKNPNWNELIIKPYKTKSKAQLKSYRKKLLIKIAMLNDLIQKIENEKNENDKIK